MSVNWRLRSKSVSSPEPIVKRDPVYERVHHGQWWLARCPDCNRIVSRYDATREEALHYGRAALASDHRCPHVGKLGGGQH